MVEKGATDYGGGNTYGMEERWKSGKAKKRRAHTIWKEVYMKRRRG